MRNVSKHDQNPRKTSGRASREIRGGGRTDGGKREPKTQDRKQRGGIEESRGKETSENRKRRKIRKENREWNHEGEKDAGKKEKLNKGSTVKTWSGFSLMFSTTWTQVLISTLLHICAAGGARAPTHDWLETGAGSEARDHRDRIKTNGRKHSCSSESGDLLEYSSEDLQDGHGAVVFKIWQIFRLVLWQFSLQLVFKRVGKTTVKLFKITNWISPFCFQGELKRINSFSPEDGARESSGNTHFTFLAAPCGRAKHWLPYWDEKCFIKIGSLT